MQIWWNLNDINLIKLSNKSNGVFCECGETGSGSSAGKENWLSNWRQKTDRNDVKRMSSVYWRSLRHSTTSHKKRRGFILSAIKIKFNRRWKLKAHRENAKPRCSSKDPKTIFASETFSYRFEHKRRRKLFYFHQILFKENFPTENFHREIFIVNRNLFCSMNETNIAESSKKYSFWS